MAISAKWCKTCRIVWQTPRVTCPNCGGRFDEDDAFTVNKGVATKTVSSAVPPGAAAEEKDDGED